MTPGRMLDVYSRQFPSSGLESIPHPDEYCAGGFDPV